MDFTKAHHEETYRIAQSRNNTADAQSDPSSPLSANTGTSM